MGNNEFNWSDLTPSVFTVRQKILTKGKFDEFTISSTDELNLNFDECLDSSKVILVQLEFDELNIDVTKFSFVKISCCTVPKLVGRMTK